MELGTGRSYIIKAKGGASTSEYGAPERERALYECAGAIPGLASFLPEFLGTIDEERFMLFEGLTTYRRLDLLTGLKDSSNTEIATLLGDALAQWHLRVSTLDHLEMMRPWLLRITASFRLSVLKTDPQLSKLVDRIVSDEALCHVIEQVRDLWQNTSLIHGDIRFANIMVNVSRGEIRFIDWETSGYGDPLWDVGGAAQEYLSLRIASHNFGAERSEQALKFFLNAYENATKSPFSWKILTKFTACRVLMRSIQIANWSEGSESSPEEHLSLAKHLATTTSESLGDWLRESSGR